MLIMPNAVLQALNVTVTKKSIIFNIPDVDRLMQDGWLHRWHWTVGHNCWFRKYLSWIQKYNLSAQENLFSKLLFIYFRTSTRLKKKQKQYCKRRHCRADRRCRADETCSRRWERNTSPPERKIPSPIRCWERHTGATKTVHQHHSFHKVWR